MDRVPETIAFNIKLRTLRNQMLRYLADTQIEQTAQRLQLQVPRELPVWQQKPSEVGYSVNDMSSRPGRKLSEYVGVVGQGGSFVCPGCKRVLALSKKYAKEQCQTCYKKEKRLRSEGGSAGSLFRS
mmetsp:Transcript_344/g.400  ORF Transcript_344/g.400 Transcript_344/m.400 type:complete len:127 (+) Transcript_344:1358-1738(+)